MPDENQPSQRPKTESAMFAEPAQERRFPTTAVAIASVAIVLLLTFLLLLGHRKGGADVPSNTRQTAAAYAPNLVLTNIQMSESESISGGKVTYIDGRIANHGSAIVTSITVQVLFANDQAMPPQIMTVPLNLIRMREPYIDTEPVSAVPLAPGAEADFRLIFEGVTENWNNHEPEIHVVRVATR